VSAVDGYLVVSHSLTPLNSIFPMLDKFQFAKFKVQGSRFKIYGLELGAED
jgi:hypothetical protein